MGKHVKGPQDHLELGTWNVICFECGCKRKAYQMKKHWQGYWVCPEHWEPRHPQDFVKATTDNQTVPWSQPRPADIFVPLVGPNDISAIVGSAVVGLAIVGFRSPLYDPSVFPNDVFSGRN